MVGRFTIPLYLSPVLAVALPALSAEPLYVKNLSPVAGLLGLPSQRGAEVEPAGRFNTALHSSIANNYVLEVREQEGLKLDGETLRFAMELRYGLSPDWDVQLEIPWLEHSGGHLDSLIDSWHDLWGMSDGGRSQAERDQLDYRYLGPEAAFLLEDDTSGLGDISLSLTRAFYRSEGATASLALGYKFATGDEDDFLGSGADDAFLALRFSGDHLSGLPLQWHGQLGYLRAGSSDILGHLQERDLWFAGLSMDWVISDRWSLIAQVDAHSAPAQSRIKALGEDAIMLSLGARWRFAEGWSVDFNFVEDAQVETAPDVTFQASLRYVP